MKRFLRTLLVSALAGGALAGVAPAAAQAAPLAPAAPVAVGVSAREFSLSLYRVKVKPGPIRFNVTNFGEDGHDLQVIAPGGKVVAQVEEMKGFGGRGQVEARLSRPGTYRLLCTIADHERRGMHAKLRVRR